LTSYDYKINLFEGEKKREEEVLLRSYFLLRVSFGIDERKHYSMQRRKKKGGKI